MADVFYDKAILLRLSEDETRALLIVLSHISGCPETTPRAYIEPIMKALQRVLPSDVQSTPYFPKIGHWTVSGTIAFLEGK